MLANSLEILAACRGFSLDQLCYEYPDEVMEPGRTPQQPLTSRVAVARRWPAGVPAGIATRLAHELRLIGQFG